MRLQKKRGNLCGVMDINKIKENVINSVLSELKSISIRTLIQDLHELRENGELNGNDSVERFNYYSHEILASKKKKFEFLRDYPILSRVLFETIIVHVDSVVELLDCFVRDREYLIQAFGLEDDSKLLSLSLQLGDSHNNGKAVMCLNFNKGKKIMYKPKSLSIDPWA
ncbi:DUF4135 domain-containing protein [Lysinibacillus sp. NPDC094403]|uniref:DUF4135 domain-containing protein n=1 Tax=Lysinibacillus sp. NPDC094403 TaxID=3390581 RepID=UPI003CFDC251